MSWRMLMIPALVAALGCSGGGGGNREVAEVAGRVVYDGKPVAAGEVYFVPVEASDEGKGALLTAAGTYTSTGIPVGKCRVAVKTNQYADKKPVVRGRSTSDPKIPAWVAEHGGGPAPMGEYVETPDRYEDALLSGLEFDVKSGKNVFDIVLTPDTKKK